MPSHIGKHHITPQSKLPFWEQWKDQNTILHQVLFKNSSLMGVSETLKTLICSHVLSCKCLSSISLYNARYVRSNHLSVPRVHLQWFYSGYDDNVRRGLLLWSSHAVSETKASRPQGELKRKQKLTHCCAQEIAWNWMNSLRKTNKYCNSCCSLKACGTAKSNSCCIHLLLAQTIWAKGFDIITNWQAQSN